MNWVRQDGVFRSLGDAAVRAATQSTGTSDDEPSEAGSSPWDLESAGLDDDPDEDW